MEQDGSQPEPGALAIVMTVATPVTPLLHDMPTVLMPGPIAATPAPKLGHNPDPFVMAVAGMPLITSFGPLG